MRIALIGRMAAGKDFVAAMLVARGFVRLSFSDALHSIVTRRVLCRPYTKSEPGIRRLLQTVGASARGDLPTPRWLLRIVVDAGIANWGTSDFWVCRLADALSECHPSAHVVISDCRHENEVAFAVGAGFDLHGVLCSEETRRRRLSDREEPHDPWAEGHVSEQLSRQMPEMVDPNRIIWNDNLPAPDCHYRLLNSFLGDVDDALRL